MRASLTEAAENVAAAAPEPVVLKLLVLVALASILLLVLAPSWVTRGVLLAVLLPATGEPLRVALPSMPLLPPSAGRSLLLLDALPLAVEAKPHDAPSHFATTGNPLLQQVQFAALCKRAACCSTPAIRSDCCITPTPATYSRVLEGQPQRPQRKTHGCATRSSTICY
jgi:hypothetical protein